MTQPVFGALALGASPAFALPDGKTLALITMGTTAKSSTTEVIVRYLIAGCCAAVLVGCSKPDQQQAKGTMADSAATTAAAPPPPAPAPTISLADVAGKWQVKTMNEKGDSTLLKYELVASADSTGWVFHFPKRKPVTAHPVVSGDSIIVDAGPYESALRKGVQVTTHGVVRLQDGKLIGTTVAHYATKGADSVLNLKTEGTRAAK